MKVSIGDISAVPRRDLLKWGAAAAAAMGLAGRVWSAAEAPAAFTRTQVSLLGAIADTIIPDTDTIGATKAGVVPFIELIVSRWMDSGQRDDFLAGMTAFDASVRQTNGAAFDRLAPTKREPLLAAALVAAQAEQKAAEHKGHAPFLVWMKRLTVHGYYTSEAGASQELILNVTPGEYVGCHQMAAGERSFSMDRRQIPFVIDNEVARIK